MGIECFFKKLDRPMTENNKKQAMMPAGATIFPNAHGTAPGLAVSENGKTAILLPGPPSGNEADVWRKRCAVPDGIFQ